MRQRKRVAALAALTLSAVAVMLALVPSASAWTVTMTAEPKLKRTNHWAIEKSVSQPAVTLASGQTADLSYSVTVKSTGSTDSDWSVAGTVKMTKDPDIGIESLGVSILSDLADTNPLPADVACMPPTFPVELGLTGLECVYGAPLPDASPRIAWMRAVSTDEPPNFRSVLTPFDFSAATVDEVDECVTVTDSMAGSLGTVCAGDAPKTFTYTVTAGPYVDCGDRTVSNTATFVTSDTGAAGSASTNATVTVTCPAAFLVIDEDSIDNGIRPNFFSANAVNDDIPRIGQRRELRHFAANPGQELYLWTGQVGDEGWFAPEPIPSSWNTAGPTSDGLRNFLLAGPGLGGGSDREKLLDKIPMVNPLRAAGLKMLIGRTVCAVVYDSDISINYGPLNGSLKGENLGIVAFEVLTVERLAGQSSSSLPKVKIRIADADQLCAGALQLFTDAPEPTSSSTPFDVRP